MNKATAIAASAWNVCGLRKGVPARPGTVLDDFDRSEVLSCLTKYKDAHDGSLFTAEEIAAAYEFLSCTTEGGRP